MIYEILLNNPIIEEERKNIVKKKIVIYRTMSKEQISKLLELQKVKRRRRAQKIYLKK